MFKLLLQLFFYCFTEQTEEKAILKEGEKKTSTNKYDIFIVTFDYVS